MAAPRGHTRLVVNKGVISAHPALPNLVIHIGLAWHGRPLFGKAVFGRRHLRCRIMMP